MAETSTKLGRVSLVPRGAYSASATYDRLDIVEHEGSGYLVLTDGVTGVTPENGQFYMLLAAQGGKGDPGTPGGKGDPGQKGDPGVGIQSVERTAGDGSPGTADTYTITLTNGNTSAFTVYNGADGTSFTVLGRYDTLSSLQAAHPTGSEGEAWAVGSAEDNVIYLWDVDAQAWQNIGSLQGPPGPAGQNGADGAPGAAGAPGTDGKSAYQYAVDGGYGGTEEEFRELMGTGPWLPLNGGTMKGDISLLNNWIKFQSDQPGVRINNSNINFDNSSVARLRFGAKGPSTPVCFTVQKVNGSTTYEIGPAYNRVSTVTNCVILSGIGKPLADYDAANKKYVDDLVGDIGSILDEINGEVA